jgi:hypothetical protein
MVAIGRRTRSGAATALFLRFFERVEPTHIGRQNERVFGHMGLWLLHSQASGQVRAMVNIFVHFYFPYGRTRFGFRGLGCRKETRCGRWKEVRRQYQRGDAQ